MSTKASLISTDTFMKLVVSVLLTLVLMEMANGEIIFFNFLKSI